MKPIGKLYNVNVILLMSLCFLATSSAWAFKNVNVKARNAVPSFTMIFSYSIFAILLHLHPNSGILVQHFNKTLNIAIEMIAVTLFSTDAIVLFDRYISTLIVINWILGTFVIFKELVKSNSYKIISKDFFFVWTIGLLIYMTFCKAISYWFVGTIILLTFNHLILDRLKLLLNISPACFYELSVVGLSFFIIFAVNSINELCSSITVL